MYGIVIPDLHIRVDARGKGSSRTHTQYTTPVQLRDVDERSCTSDKFPPYSFSARQASQEFCQEYAVCRRSFCYISYSFGCNVLWFLQMWICACVFRPVWVCHSADVSLVTQGAPGARAVRSIRRHRFQVHVHTGSRCKYFFKLLPICVRCCWCPGREQ